MATRSYTTYSYKVSYKLDIREYDYERVNTVVYWEKLFPKQDLKQDLEADIWGVELLMFFHLEKKTFSFDPHLHMALDNLRFIQFRQCIE